MATKRTHKNLPDDANATLTLRGVDLITDKVRTLPHAPGVYQMFDENGNVLYVGKSKNLKTRVKSYTRPQSTSTRIARMIYLTCAMEFIRTETETDALLLEANLIKKLKPRYNVVLRDDKSFPYILLARDHPIPRIIKHRGAHKREGAYFGPFASAGAVNRTVDTLQRAFLLRTCSDNVYATRTRPCLLHQIKRCSAPCTGEISNADYNVLVDEAENFLSGDSRAMQKRLVLKMQNASKSQDYEVAATARDRIRALNYVQTESPINPRNIAAADVIVATRAGGQCCVYVMFFRANQNLGAHAYFPRHEADVSVPEVVEAFIGQFYDNRTPPPSILLNVNPSHAELLAEALGYKAGRKVALHLPQRGNKYELVTHAVQNARESLARRMAERASQQKILNALADVFKLPSVPKRIDVFDNSHFQGTHQLGAMIVAGTEGFIKNQYRKFNIKDTTSTPGDDYAMMNEVLGRRYGRLVHMKAAEAQENRPDLILLDGGRGQLSIAEQVMESLNLKDIPLIAIAKGIDRNAGRERFFSRTHHNFTLPAESPVLYYVQRLRDEAHRFAIGGHRKKRHAAIRQTSLNDIDGIGAARKRALLHHFGSARAVVQAPTAELEKVDGISVKMAHKIYAHYRDS